MSLILPCLPLFLSGFHYIFTVFMLGFIFLLLKGLIDL